MPSYSPNNAMILTDRRGLVLRQLKLYETHKKHPENGPKAGHNYRCYEQKLIRLLFVFNFRFY